MVFEVSWICNAFTGKLSCYALAVYVNFVFHDFDGVPAKSTFYCEVAGNFMAMGMKILPPTYVSCYGAISLIISR